MSTKLRRLRKRSRAFFTDERLLSGVCPYMVIQRRRARERPCAKTAFERPLAVVRHHVRAQVRGVRKGLGTMATLIGLFGQTRADVDLQQRTLAETFETLPASPDACLEVSRALAWTCAPAVHVLRVSGFLRDRRQFRRIVFIAQQRGTSTVEGRRRAHELRVAM